MHPAGFVRDLVIREQIRQGYLDEAAHARLCRQAGHPSVWSVAWSWIVRLVSRVRAPRAGAMPPAPIAPPIAPWIEPRA